MTALILHGTARTAKKQIDWAGKYGARHSIDRNLCHRDSYPTLTDSNALGELLPSVNCYFDIRVHLGQDWWGIGVASGFTPGSDLGAWAPAGTAVYGASNQDLVVDGATVSYPGFNPGQYPATKTTRFALNYSTNTLYVSPLTNGIPGTVYSCSLPSGYDNTAMRPLFTILSARIGPSLVYLRGVGLGSGGLY